MVRSDADWSVVGELGIIVKTDGRENGGKVERGSQYYGCRGRMNRRPFWVGISASAGWVWGWVRVPPS